MAIIKVKIELALKCINIPALYEYCFKYMKSKYL